MKKSVNFYRCPICGNVIELVDGDINHMRCCGQEMELMVANTQDAAVEKHVPVYEKVEDEIVVKVGEVDHPMEKDHYIMWVAQVNDNQVSRVTLYPEQGINVRFKYIPNSTIYAYCNKHGLWKVEVK